MIPGRNNDSFWITWYYNSMMNVIQLKYFSAISKRRILKIKKNLYMDIYSKSISVSIIREMMYHSYISEVYAKNLWWQRFYEKCKFFFLFLEVKKLISYTSDVKHG